MQSDKLEVTQAETIVALHIEEWGWGPIEEIEGLSEHKLAVDACLAGMREAARPLEERLKQAEKLAEALGELIAACDGESYEVFAVEIGAELDASAKALFQWDATR